MKNIPNITFVACVESGPLEDQAVRLLESRTRFAGPFAACPLFLVKARRGPALSRRTREAADAAGARVLAVSGVRGWEWMHYLNKPVALAAVEGVARTDRICWIDSDVLFLREPQALLPADGADFTACPADKNVGTSGPDDPNEPYWQAVCRALGMTVDDLPMVVTATEGVAIRWYFNSGVFAYRRESGFGRAFLDDCLRLLAARVASRQAGIFFTDQVVMGLTALRLGLRFAALPFSHNQTMGSKSEAPMDATTLSQAALLHYHDALWPHFWPTLLDRLEPARSDVAAWLRESGPMSNPASVPAKLLGKALSLWRTRQKRAYIGSCHVY